MTNPDEFDTEKWEIRELFVGQYGDGFYIYKFGKLWGWAKDMEQAKILIKGDEVKERVKKKDGGSHIPF